MLEIIDLSQEIFSGRPVFPGLPRVDITIHATHEEWDGITDSDVVSPGVNLLELGEHIGDRMKVMQKPSADEYAPGYQKYFDLVPEGEYLSLLRQNSTETIRFFEDVANEKIDYRYAEGKWTVKEVLMHLIDTERVFSYRALTAARGDSSPHYRMDEELYAGNVDVSPREIASLIAEFKAVRGASEQLFENLSEAQSKLTCNIVPHPMTARAIGYFLIAHIRHHRNVIEERYL